MFSTSFSKMVAVLSILTGAIRIGTCLVCLGILGGTSSVEMFCMLFFRPRDESRNWLLPSGREQKALLKVDLRPYGFGAAKPWKTSSFRIAVLNREYHEVAFAGSEKIIAAITSSPNPDARHLKALTTVILDARSGSILGTGTWDAVYDKLGLLPTPSGNIVIRVDDELRVYTSELKLLQEIVVPLSRIPGPKYWKAILTSSGKSLVLAHGVDKSLELKWLEPDTLKLKETWNAPDGMFYQTGNDYVPVDDGVLVTIQDSRFGTCGVNFVDFNSAWTQSYRSSTPCKTAAQALDNTTFYVRVGNELILIKRDGSILFRQSTKKGEFASVIRSSADGNRLAIAFVSYKGGSDFFDVTSHEVLKRIQVLDVPSREMIFTLENKGIDLQSVSDFGLSPDGSQLVVLRGGIVESYSVLAN
jgi:hypothetical protein